MNARQSQSQDSGQAHLGQQESYYEFSQPVLVVGPLTDGDHATNRMAIGSGRQLQRLTVITGGKYASRWPHVGHRTLWVRTVQ